MFDPSSVRSFVERYIRQFHLSETNINPLKKKEAPSLDALPAANAAFAELTNKIADMVNEELLPEFKTHASLKSGVRKVLQRFSAAGIPLGVATSTTREMAEVVLSHYGILHYFVEVRSSDQFEHGKPAADIFMRTATDIVGLSEAERPLEKLIEHSRRREQEIISEKTTQTDTTLSMVPKTFTPSLISTENAMKAVHILCKQCEQSLPSSSITSSSKQAIKPLFVCFEDNIASMRVLRNESNVNWIIGGVLDETFSRSHLEITQTASFVFSEWTDL
eukprot:MONOS_5239.2-p1 / transcript=MONOS_5239.2 / gene=MONOS_5239 / organism=Monocercomonoides_exilis_PA203 / gene_product=HAD-family hydrolase, unspecified product / transcript_product=unspecified product / location=Mono_scaffold00150:17799-18702(-) / protein_length=276 / sequence_SO=supercontig / SO=protein_coding / is_pseudo=false